MLFGSKIRTLGKFVFIQQYKRAGCVIIFRFVTKYKTLSISTKYEPVSEYDRREDLGWSGGGQIDRKQLKQRRVKHNASYKSWIFKIYIFDQS